MSFSEIVIKVIGLILAVVGLGLLLATVGVGFLGLGLGAWYWNAIAGFVFLGAGIYIIRGGTVSL